MLAGGNACIRSPSAPQNIFPIHPHDRVQQRVERVHSLEEKLSSLNG
jgi:hypothetical protein